MLEHRISRLNLQPFSTLQVPIWQINNLRARARMRVCPSDRLLQTERSLKIIFRHLGTVDLLKQFHDLIELNIESFHSLILARTIVLRHVFQQMLTPMADK